MSLLTKLLLIFCVILIVSFGLLNAITAAQIARENDITIEEEQRELMQSCSTLVVSFFVEEDFSETAAGFAAAGERIARELTAVFSNPAGAYMPDGSALYLPAEFMAETTQDVQIAMQGNSSYTVIQQDEHVSVYLSFPVTAGDDIIGIMRLNSDYTDLYEAGNIRTATMLTETLVALGIAFVLAILIVYRVLSPVRTLKNSMAEFAKNPRQHENVPEDRSDEIGQLARAYNVMADTIVGQMDMIEAEKDVLADTIRYRKEFFDNVTHELKTPITIIMGYADMLQDADPESEFFKQGLQNISQESRRLSNMVVELLEESRFSHSARMTPGRVDINALIEQISGTMELKAKRYDVSIDQKLEEKLAIKGNEEKIRRLFVNLMDNAIKYSPAHEKLVIKGYVQGEEVCMEFGNRMAAPMKEEELQNIFKPFFRAESGGETGSVGLGLAICKDIVEEHGGSIDASLNNEGLGISVQVRFERCE